MSSIRRELLELIVKPDEAFNMPSADLAPLQLQAAQELLDEKYEKIPLLRKRADDAGVDRIRSFDDIVPLLFAHTVYKSYPQSFFDQGRWDRMLQWLQTISVQKVTDVDVSGVTNVDEWIERLHDAGHMVLATSGTSGKVSFLNHTRGDQEMKKRHFRYAVGWPLVDMVNSAQRPMFWLGPARGPNSAIESHVINSANFGKAGAIYALTEEPLRIGDVSKAASLRKRMSEGTAEPREIEALQTHNAAKAERAQAAMRKIADMILDMRHEPIYVAGLWAQHMVVMERARERGIPDGDFHPATVIQAGGGVKGVALPPDYQEQVDRFYGKVIRPGAYRMTEMAQMLPRCEAGRYHRAAGQIILPLDASGEKLLKPGSVANGAVEARMAFLDLGYEGRWGGTITGDKVTIDFSDRCPCGRHGPTILDNITRFAQQPGENDHIGCAGTIDSYVRGMVNA
ncbi:MAG: hypothetical protein CPSOU_3121 [uncultured Paraburkholderia sp.]|nr:MAG: hypothetical protein CPSOU_3121 [uncultured Paraburkholderia sp.]